MKTLTFESDGDPGPGFRPFAWRSSALDTGNDWSPRRSWIPSRVVAVSETAARSVARAFGLQEEQVAVVWNGVDTGLFRPLPEANREPGRLLFVGDSEDENKGFRYLLLALGRLAPSMPFQLTVVQQIGRAHV